MKSQMRHLSLVMAVPATLVLLLTAPASAGAAQAQQAWLGRYNAGLPTSTNQAVAMARDAAGNVIIAGSGTGAAGDFDYITLKYSPSGNLLWSARYASLSNGTDQVRGMAMDKQGNVIVTGTSDTVKYNSNGVQQWTAPYGGRAIAVETNGSAYVTGFSTVDYVTVKLSSQGSNLWLRTHDVIGQPDVSQAIAVDFAGNVYVAGIEDYYCSRPWDCYLYLRIGIVKYSGNGALMWMNGFPNEQHQSSAEYKTEVRGLFVTSSGNLVVTGNLRGTPNRGYYTCNLNEAGQVTWSYAKPILTGTPGVNAIVLGLDDSLLLTGRAYDSTDDPNPVFLTSKVRADGTEAWRAAFKPDPGYHVGNALGIDAAGNAYAAGVSRLNGGNNDWITFKYNGTNGGQMWVERYNGPANGDDQATAIAVTPSGEVYVAGHSANPNGGVDLVVIKYVELANIQWQGTNVLLQFCATNGLACRFQGSTNLLDWQDLATVAPDSNGICRYTDTNAPAHPHRFYRTVTP